MIIPIDMHPDLVREAGQRAAECREFVGLRPGSGRNRWMNVERGVVGLERLEDRPVRQLIEITAAEM
jgi:hypothetical protein